MSYKTGYIEDGNIVTIQGFGRLTIEEYKKGVVDVVDQLERHSSTRVLSDNRLLDNAPSVDEIYGLPKFFRDVGLPASVRVAVLFDASKENEDIFFETVCVNRVMS